MIPGTPVCIFRGATVHFSTTFYDAAGLPMQPSGAQVNIEYVPVGSKQIQAILIEMTPPSGDAIQWTAQWDSRNVLPGRVSWSIHTEGSVIPYAVEDGAFDLTANNANLPTF